MFDFLKKVPVHLSPRVHGRITYQGQPVRGLEVVRVLECNQMKTPCIDRVFTDDTGSFSFAERILEMRILPLAEVVRRQAIQVTYREQDYCLWRAHVFSIRPLAILQEKLAALECELTDRQQQYDFVDPQHPAMPISVISKCHLESR